MIRDTVPADIRMTPVIIKPLTAYSHTATENLEERNDDNILGTSGQFAK